MDLATGLKRLIACLYLPLCLWIPHCLWVEVAILVPWLSGKCWRSDRENRCLDTWYMQGACELLDCCYCKLDRLFGGFAQNHDLRLSKEFVLELAVGETWQSPLANFTHTPQAVLRTVWFLNMNHRRGHLAYPLTCFLNQPCGPLVLGPLHL